MNFYASYPFEAGGGGGVTSVNGATGPAITIAAGTGISVTTVLNTITITNTEGSTVEPANTVFAGPTSGAPALPTFRALVSADIPSLSAIYVDLTTNQTIAGNKTFTGNTTEANLTINGTAGNGFIELMDQSVTPPTPVGGITMFADSTARWTTVNPNGFTATWDTSGITANRVYTTRDVSGKILLDTRWSAAATTLTTGTTTILASDAFAVYLLDSSGGTITVDLPTAAGVADRVYTFKGISGNMETNNFTLVPSGADKIEGLNANKIFQTNFGSWTLLSDGVSAWWMI